MNSGLTLNLALSPGLKAALFITLVATALVALWSAWTELPPDVVPVQNTLDLLNRAQRTLLPQPQPQAQPVSLPLPLPLSPNRSTPWPALNPAAAAAWDGPVQPAMAAASSVPPLVRQLQAQTPAAPPTLVAAPAPTPPLAGTPFPYTLIGVLQQAGVHTALLEGPQRSLAVRGQDLIDGQWQVLQVTPDAMELLLISEQKRLRVAYAPP